ncbi:FAD-dependent thymidylate synthase [Salmonella enterica subsp. enterica serovar Newport]|nr:FAD-dependent thymidylate synthase [Salmonella enterica subsp. enterica serovar Newport]
MQVKYVDHMGNDQRIVDVARQSFAKTDATVRTEAQNQGLLRYLAEGISSKQRDEIINMIQMGTINTYEGTGDGAEELYRDIRHQSVHWTPFAHTAITLQMQAPIPIRTQAFKHKQGLVENEESRRYISTTPEIYIPEFRLRPEGSIKQGSAGIHPDNDAWKSSYIEITHAAVFMYERMIAEGIAPEQARFVLPQGVEVNWTWTGNLLAFANFYNKRSDAHAQQEIQDLAEMVREIIEPLFPMSWKALTQ